MNHLKNRINFSSRETAMQQGRSRLALYCCTPYFAQRGNKMLTFDYGNMENESNTVRVLISDMIGRQVISEEALPAINHKANLNIEQLPAGNYLYKVEIAGKEFTGRITKN